jgi:hypothetical protein
MSKDYLTIGFDPLPVLDTIYTLLDGCVIKTNTGQTLNKQTINLSKLPSKNTNSIKNLGNFIIKKYELKSLLLKYKINFTNVKIEYPIPKNFFTQLSKIKINFCKIIYIMDLTDNRIKPIDFLRELIINYGEKILRNLVIFFKCDKIFLGGNPSNNIKEGKLQEIFDKQCDTYTNRVTLRTNQIENYLEKQVKEYREIRSCKTNKEIRYYINEIQIFEIGNAIYELQNTYTKKVTHLPYINHDSFLKKMDWKDSLIEFLEKDVETPINLNSINKSMDLKRKKFDKDTKKFKIFEKALDLTKRNNEKRNELQAQQESLEQLKILKVLVIGLFKSASNCKMPENVNDFPDFILNMIKSPEFQDSTDYATDLAIANAIQNTLTCIAEKDTKMMFLQEFINNKNLLEQTEISSDDSDSDDD